jgi:hypothetical protein
MTDLTVLAELKGDKGKTTPTQTVPQGTVGLRPRLVDRRYIPFEEALQAGPDSQFLPPTHPRD